MKKLSVVTLVLVVGIMFVTPTMGYSDPFGGYPGAVRHPAYSDHRIRQPYYPPPVHYERSHSNDALVVAGVALGGIALGALVGSIIGHERIAYHEPVSAQPPAYAEAYNSTPPPGQWVTVAGQWVNGTWVPEHKVWVPVNP